MNRIINPCETVLIDEREYRINTNFLVWIDIEDIFMKNASFDEVSAAKILKLAYPILPSSPVEAFEKIMWFYACGEVLPTAGKDKIIKAPVVNLKKDFPYIWAAFLGEFGIDLSVQNLHWWKFRYLMMSLDENSKFCRIVSYRRMNTSEIKDKNTRTFYEKMKQKYKLQDLRSSDEREREIALTFEGLF